MVKMGANENSLSHLDSGALIFLADIQTFMFD